MRLLVVVLIVSVASIVVIGLAFSWWQASSTPPPSAGHACGVSDDQWHPPVVGSCQVGHEHGDAPPAWVTLRYTGAFNTSVHENGHGPDAANPTRVGKHEAMKGQSWSAGGLDYYVRYHGNSNVLDRMARFHSSEVWVRESSNGKVSHVAMWGNSGDPQKFGDGQAGAGGRRNTCSAEIDIRPEVHVVTTMTDYQTCNAAEFWYLYPSGPGPDAPGSWGPTVSFLVNATTLAFANEAANPSMTTWQTTGALGIARQVKVEINGPSAPIKDQPFWTTQFLELVSGPTDPKCSATTTFAAQPGDTINPFVHAETYQHVCLQQFISGTLPAFSSTSPGKDFSAPGLRLPN